MRTDGVTIAPDAVAELRATAERLFGPDYIPETPRVYK